MEKVCAQSVEPSKHITLQSILTKHIAGQEDGHTELTTRQEGNDGQAGID